MGPTFTHNRVSCIELSGCVKILFNCRDQTQRCNSRLDLFESQLRASTSTGSNSWHSNHLSSDRFNDRFGVTIRISNKRAERFRSESDLNHTSGVVYLLASAARGLVNGHSHSHTDCILLLLSCSANNNR